ncbi:Eukaryotic translation initiation factor 4 gamma [Cercospora beticola]|uniref:Eukaryotic translation initiation factor 4 gamma n=1 Tax=Cercospora beticola TaxID=122368 RepID=A0A2G5HXT0_CERBT|nr:Eukaryotic translation initiation factor 4 gamma [Cercospora beticola]PIA97083.1 Eukaryotic translation initiation factor 4 gamma [Cercospora beticola]WPA98611.1 hypothetical protein RHO25_003223 [Cercospora beticola]CAK1359870.1 unnamed protein product [Cercospora beticola]
MTSATSGDSTVPVSASQTANTPSATTASTTSSLPQAVSSQPAVKSYANATKTATPPTSAGASAPAQNAAKSNDAQLNGSMAQGGSQQPAHGVSNGTSNTADHTRKTSVVINASGASGSFPNGGPVGQNGTRPSINFGMMSAQGGEQASAPQHSHSASLQQPRQDPRVTTPTHSPSPIPQPAASGGRPPSSLPNQNNGGLAFGSLPADTETMRGHGHIPPANAPAHERRPSSHSMQSELSSQGMRPGFPPQGRGSGRGQQFTPGQQYMGSPGAQYRNLQGQPPRNSFPQQFNPQQPPGSPYGRPAARASPVPMNAQPQMQGQQMHYQQHGYPMHPQQQQQMYGMPPYDASSGHYNPYYYPPQYYGQPPQSPRPGYPSPFQGNAAGMQPPFHPSAAPGMARTPSQASERPASSLSHPQTPAQTAPVPSGTPGPGPATPVQSSSFIRPVKKSNAIKITDANGNAIDFTKPATPAQSSSQGPVIVSTPNAPTPPPRAGSNNHNRAESKSAPSSESTKNAFAEQVKRKIDEDKRLAAEAEAAKSKETADKAAESKKAEEAAATQVKEAAAEAEKAAAKAADDKKAEEDAEAAKKALENEEAEKTRKQQEEDERLEREIAEMEAKYAAEEKEEEERERAYQEKKAKEKAEREAKEKANLDEKLKQQEREAEAREEAREREREAADKKDVDEEAKSMFAQLKKTTLGPQGSSAATPSGTETPTSEKESEEPAESTPAAAAPRAGASKPKPAHLKLETNKPVERAEPTPGMQALKSSRFLELKEEAKYPDGFKSPNPALNPNGARKGHAYDKSFLLQFQNIFKEKPSVDWDQKVKDTLGPSDDSARTPARTPSNMGSRQGSRGGQPFGGPMGGAMGSFAGPMGTGNARGTTSEQRFQAAQMGAMGGRPGMPAGRVPSQLVGMGQAGGISRSNSSLQMGNMNSRQQSSRGGGRGGSRNDRQHSKRQEQADASKMPLTAHMEIKPIEVTQSGWKPMSLQGNGGPSNSGPDPSGLMAPDMVQRKVKAALNKMTPEKFDKISDQILEIAAQSKHEVDGRTLRQVIQLTFEKACDEAHWAGMYAKFCHKMLTTMSTEIRDETIKDKNGNPVVGGALFRKYLLNRCQEEFERGWQANLPDKPEGESQEAALLSDEYYVAAAAKRRGLGLIQFIGQLYKLRMLTLRIMHECVMRLLNFEGDPDEAAIENLTTLLRSVGSTMDEEEQGQQLMKTYFDRIDQAIMQNKNLPSRPRFMVLDLIDLRKAGWKGKDSAKGPKTIQEIHDEAALAQAKAEAEKAKGPRGGAPGGRMPAGRGDARNFSGGMPPPQDYNRTNVAMDDLRKLQARGSNPRSGSSLGPGGSLGPAGLGPRTGSRRGAGGLGPGSTGTSRTNTPPVGDKKEEPATAQNAFSALASLDASGDQPEEAQSEAASPPAARNRSKSPTAAEKDETAV